MKRVLTIAGSDSGGGAGIQADLKTITVLGAFGTSVLTALTAQNTLGVQGIHEVPVDFVRQQMDAVLTDIGADAVKTGMLASAALVGEVADGLRRHQTGPLVVDPVMAATSGDSLLARDAVETIKAELIPLAFLVTPNLPEASMLAGFPVSDMAGMEEAARQIFALGPKNVLIKGGHLNDEAADLLYDGREFRVFSCPKIETRNTHGTGCTYSAALATFLAQGKTVVEAVAAAKDYISRAIRFATPMGSGNGPTNAYAHVANHLEREAVLSELGEALERFLSEPLGRLVPEIRTNFGYALPAASTPDEIAAIPGRVTNRGSRLLCWSEPAFGGSRHVAKVILAAMDFDPSLRSAMAIRHDGEIMRACRELGFNMAVFSRADEPKEVKEREGSSLEWGTRQALRGFKGTPDLVYDEGGPGKEPIVRLLGRTPGEVVDKAMAIGRRLGL